MTLFNHPDTHAVFQEMFDKLLPIKQQKIYNNYIWMGISPKYKYSILLIITYYIYKNSKKIKQILLDKFTT
jgi:hypothetical protein